MNNIRKLRKTGILYVHHCLAGLNNILIFFYISLFYLKKVAIFALAKTK